jgi:preprotein translocase subunit YajC
MCDPARPVAADLPPAVSVLWKGLFVSLLLPLLLFGVVYFVLILPQSRRRKQAASLQRAVEPGSRVLLTSGLYGTVVEVEDDALIIEAAEGIELRYAKAAVLRVLPDEVDSNEDESDDADYEYDDENSDADQSDDAEPAEHKDAPATEHDGDTVARPSNREDPKAQDDSAGTSGNDAGSGPVPTS